MDYYNIQGIVIPVWGFGRAGGDRVLAKLASSFHSMGVKTVMISYYYTNEPYYPVECPILYVDKEGNVTGQKNVESNRSWTEKIRQYYERRKGLKKALDKLSPEYNIAIANYSLTALIVDQCKVKNKFYYIQAYEVFDTERDKNLVLRFKNNQIRKSYRLNLHRIVNADIYRDYKEIHAEDVVPPGLDLENYHPKDNLMINRKEIVVGCIGRAAKWKGSNDAAKAVEILQNEGFDIKFLVAFNPVDYSVFELVKPDGDDNLANYYRSLDILIAPGTLQLGAIHYPVIEAMACGTTVITTGYYPADNTNAYLVPVSSPEMIAETIKYIYNNRREAAFKAEKALKDVKELSWDKVSNRMLSIINDKANIGGIS